MLKAGKISDYCKKQIAGTEGSFAQAQFADDEWLKPMQVCMYESLEEPKWLPNICAIFRACMLVRIRGMDFSS